MLIKDKDLSYTINILNIFIIIRRLRIHETITELKIYNLCYFFSNFDKSIETLYVYVSTYILTQALQI